MLKFLRSFNSSSAAVRRTSHRRYSSLRLEPLECRNLLAGWAIGIEASPSSFATTWFHNAVAPDGSVFVVGDFSGTFDFDPTVGTFALTSGLTAGKHPSSSRDAYVAKYDAMGNLAWARKFGGAGDDIARVVTYDPSGAVIVGGSFQAGVDFTGDGTSDAISNGNGNWDDAFLVKLDSATGTTTWFRTFGGSGDDRVNDVAINSGQIYSAGMFSNTADLNPGAGTFSLAAAGTGKVRSSDGFVQQLDANGNFVRAWQLGGTSGDLVNSLQVDNSGVSVLGTFSGTADFQPGSGVSNLTSIRTSDAFLARYSIDGINVNLQFARVIASDGPYASLASNGDSLIVTGELNGDALVSSYDKMGGSIQWTHTFGQSGTAESALPRAAVEPVSGEIYVAGVFYGTLDFTPGIAGDELTSVGDRDSVLVKYDRYGAFLNAWRFGGPGRDGGTRPAGVVGDTVYVTGLIAQGTCDFPSGDILTVTSGFQDLYVTAIVDAAAPLHADAVGLNKSSTRLSATEVASLLPTALARWQAAGVDTSLFSALNIRIGNLGGTTLGLASGNTIWLDDNAAGWGWFVDSTPGNDSEFVLPGNQGERNRMDLLTVVMHELGHLLGHGHDEEGVMAETLAAGVRRTGPEHDAVAPADQVFGQSGDHRADGWLGAWLNEQFDSAHGRAKRRR